MHNFLDKKKEKAFIKKKKHLYIYLDFLFYFRKAFDKVSHRLLLYKLSSTNLDQNIYR